MLQVVDEFDDAVHAVRQQLEGIGQEIGLALGGIAAFGAVAVAVAMGASALVIASGVAILGGAAFMKLQGTLSSHR